MRLQEKFDQYLRRKIAIAKINRLFKSNLNTAKAEVFQRLKSSSGQQNVLSKRPTRDGPKTRESKDESKNAYDVFKTYLRETTPKKPISKASIEKAFAAKKMFSVINTLIKKARTKFIAFSVLKRAVFFSFHPASISLDISDNRILFPKNYTKDAASKARFASAVKKLSDFVFKHKESAFYHLKARIHLPEEGRNSAKNRAPSKEGYKAKISQFFDSRRSRNRKSLEGIKTLAQAESESGSTKNKLLNGLIE